MDIITMSMREVNRLKVMHKVLLRDITQGKAAELLGITDRHVRRVVKRVREEGDKGIVHKSRGRSSPRRMSKEEEDRIAEIVETRYVDFGPTLAAEKLCERHDIKVGREKLRQIMIAKGLWHVRRRKKIVHQWRIRLVCEHYSFPIWSIILKKCVNLG